MKLAWPPAILGPPAILVVEDRDSVREMLLDALGGEGYQVTTAATCRAGLAELAEHHFAFVVSDLMLPDGSGLEVVDAAKAAGTPIVVLTAYGNVGTAVDAMKRGALDFLEKPVRLEALLGIVERELGAAEPRPAVFQAPGGPALVGAAPAFRQALRLLERAAPTQATVLLLGESGTGKELFARSLHLLSPRAKRPFVAVNCAAIPAPLVESELFGHEKGAFTGAHQRQIGRFEAAHQGTLFLDEIGELPAGAQAKVLRAIEERVVERVGGSRPLEVDVRLVAATNRDLAAMVDAGSFRADLYFRLDVFPIHLPSLAQRRDDIPALATHLLERATSRHGLPAASLTEDAQVALMGRNWPGNVRELANVVERAAILAGGGQLDASRVVTTAATTPAAQSEERARLAEALQACDGDANRAAELLGWSYRTVMRRISQFNLRGYPRWRGDS